MQKPNITVTRSPKGGYVVRENGRWIRRLGRVPQGRARELAARRRVSTAK